MHNEKRRIEELLGFIIISLPLLMIPTILFGGEADKKPERYSESQGDYVLMVKGNLISLKAKDASFNEILEEIGRRMKIEVVANIPKEERITVEFDMMYLGDAIKRFRTSYAYITEVEKDKGKITKIIVVPKGLGKVRSNKFEYAPWPSIEKDEVKEEKRPVEPEFRARKEVGTEQPSRTETFRFESGPQPSIQGEASYPEPSEFDYNPQPSLE
jgi:hypothetical protein